MDVDQTAQLDQIQATLAQIRTASSNGINNSELVDIKAKLTSLIDEIPRLTKQQKILASLRFREIRFRHAAIVEAHAHTLSWIFQQTQLDAGIPPVKFVEWLESPDSVGSIFWVGGKAGSGKSTLMKFVCNHDQTISALQRWAGSHKLVTGSFFFWHNGADLQKTAEIVSRAKQQPHWQHGCNEAIHAKGDNGLIACERKESLNRRSWHPTTNHDRSKREESAD